MVVDDIDVADDVVADVDVVVDVGVADDNVVVAVGLNYIEVCYGIEGVCRLRLRSSTLCDNVEGVVIYKC